MSNEKANPGLVGVEYLRRQAANYSRIAVEAEQLLVYSKRLGEIPGVSDVRIDSGYDFNARWTAVVVCSATVEALREIRLTFGGYRVGGKYFPDRYHGKRMSSTLQFKLFPLLVTVELDTPKQLLKRGNKCRVQKQKRVYTNYAMVCA